MPLFSKQILKPGRYLARDLTGKRVEFNVTPERIEHWIENFGKMKRAGLNVPAPWKHDPKSVPSSEASSRDNAGFWEKLWVAPDGCLHGQINVPRAEDASRIGTTVKEVSPLVRPEWKDGMGADWQDSISHIALVQKPVASGQDNFEEVVEEKDRLAVAASLTDYVGVALDANIAGDDQSGKLPTSATAPSIQDVLAALAETGLSLPEDTTFENLAERIVVACKAISGSQDSEDETQEGKPMTKEQPNPIAMAEEIKILKETVTTKTTELETQTAANTKLKTRVDGFVALSLEQQKKGFEVRLSDLAKPPSPKLTQEFYNKTIKPLLDAYVLSFDEDGKIQPTELDLIIETLEASPGIDPKAQFFQGSGVQLGPVHEEPNPFSHTPEEDDEEAVNADADLIAEAGGCELVK